MERLMDKLSELIGVNCSIIEQDNVKYSSGKKPFFCEIINNKIPNECVRSYREVMKDKTIVFKCHANCVNIIVPVRNKEYVLVGPVRINQKEDFNKITEKTNIEIEELSEHFKEIKHVENIKELADKVSLAINLTKDFVKEKQNTEYKLKDLETIYEITNAINSSLELNQILWRVVNILKENVNIGFCTINDNNKKYILEGDKLPQKYRDYENIIEQKVRETGESIFIENINEDKTFNNEITFTIVKSFVSIPLKIKGKIIGTMNLFLNGDVKLKLLETVANQAAVAINNAKQFEKINEMAVTDKLTGFFNRRYFMNILNNEVERSKRFNQPLSVIMIDIDYFGIYNNNNGHQAGDKLLKELSEIFKKNVRSTDIIGRYGGEEFIIIMPQTKPNEMSIVTERIINSVRNKIFDNQESQPNKNITISMGAFIAMDGSLNTEQMIKEADKALYEAKHSGRDKIISKILLKEGMRIINLE